MIDISLAMAEDEVWADLFNRAAIDFNSLSSGERVRAGWMWFEGAANQNLSSISALTIPKLRVDNGNRLVLGSDINISTEVDLMNNGLHLQ